MKLARNPKIVNAKFKEYFLPTVLISLANNLAIIVDSIMVGNILGSTEMGAIQLFTPINQFYFALTVLFGLGSSTLISLAKAARRKKEADSILTVTFVSISILTVLLMVVQFMFLTQIVDYLTLLKHMEELITAYYIPFLIGTPFQLYLCSFVYCIRSDGRPKFASNLMIISNVINLCMDYVLMAIFNLGIAGSAIATVIGNVVSFILMLSQFWYKENTLRFDFSICRKVSDFFKELFSVFKTGISGAFATLLVTIRVFFLNQMVEFYGNNNGIVAMSIASMGLIFVSSIITGACQTMVPLISTFYAQEDNKSVVYTFVRAVLYMMVVLLVIAALLEFFPSAFSAIFGDKTAAELAASNTAVRITALSYPGLGLTFLFLYYFTSIQRNTMSLILSFANGLLSVPVSYVTSLFLKLNGVWIGIVVAQYLTLALAIAMLAFEKLRKKSEYENLFLLKPNKSEIANFTLKSNCSEEEVKDALKAQPKLESKASIIASALTHLKSDSKPAFDIDVRINENEPDLIVNCRINEENVNIDHLKNIELENIETDKILGMNEIRITI